MEAVITVLALRHGVVPPTVNLRDPDPGAPLQHVRTARPLDLRAALSNSFGFGGHNTCLAFTRHVAAP
jgi:3-oxoacyl-[acyl-carrier-protein] synthase II